MDPQLRSQPSRRLTFVRFENATLRKVDVIWINFEGGRVKYKTLEPKQFFDVNTYVKHPWLFQDALTHEPLVVKSKPVFQPGPWYEVSPLETEIKSCVLLLRVFHSFLLIRNFFLN